MADKLAEIPKTELHQHVDGSIPVRTTWGLIKRHGLAPVPTLREMRPLLQLQADEAGSLLAYLDKFHYPMWITQFYENIVKVTEEIIRDAYAHGVRLLELRHSPATASASASRRSVHATSAPASANIRQIALPIPAPPPVMIKPRSRYRAGKCT